VVADENKTNCDQGGGGGNIDWPSFDKGVAQKKSGGLLRRIHCFLLHVHTHMKILEQVVQQQKTKGPFWQERKNGLTRLIIHS